MLAATNPGRARDRRDSRWELAGAPGSLRQRLWSHYHTQATPAMITTLHGAHKPPQTEPPESLSHSGRSSRIPTPHRAQGLPTRPLSQQHNPCAGAPGQPGEETCGTRAPHPSHCDPTSCNWQHQPRMDRRCSSRSASIAARWAEHPIPRHCCGTRPVHQEQSSGTARDPTGSAGQTQMHAMSPHVEH